MPFLAPVFGAIGSAVSGVLSFLGGSGIFAGIARLGLSIAARYAVNAFLGGPKKQKTPALAVQLDTTYGEDLARTVILGTVGTAGHHVYRNAYGDGNHIVQDVYALSSFRINGVTRVRYNGEWKTLGGAENADFGFRISGISAVVWVKVYTGTMDQTADAALISHSNPSGRWTSAHKGTGIAYAIVTSVLDREHLTSPWEAFFEVEGAPLYDWRKDTSVGGDGDHRWSDQSTWEFDANHNPVLMMYALERGIFNGTEKMVGKGVAASKLPLTQWTTAANIADESATGGTRYRASCIATSGEGTTHDDNMQPLRESCAATWVELVDGEYPIVGAEQAVVATFTDDDLVVGQPYRYSAKRTRSEMVNTVAGSFIDPGNFYQSVPFTTRIDETALAEDGERMAASISYTAVTVPECVDRLADIAILASRYQASAEIWLRPKFITLKPGDWVTWDSDRNSTKTYQVVSKQLGPFGSNNCRNVHLSLQQVADGIFDGTGYVTTPPDGAVQGDPSYLTEVQNLVVAGISVVVDGGTVPGLRATWTAITDPTVTAVEVKWYPTGQSDAAITNTIPVDQSSMVTLDVVAGTEYQVSTRLVTAPFRTSAWSAPKTATTPQAGYVFWPVDLGDISDRFTDLEQNFAANIRALSDQIAQVALGDADGQFGAYQDSQAVYQRVMSATGDVSAAVTQAILAATGPDSAIATAITQLNGSANGQFADATWQLSTEYTPATGWDTQWGVQVRASTSVGWSDAGLFARAKSDGTSELLFSAGKVIFVDTDSGAEVTPIVFDAGKAYLDSVIATSIEVKSATTGARTIITDTLIQVYDENNVERVRLGVWT